MPTQAGGSSRLDHRHPRRMTEYPWTRCLTRPRPALATTRSWDSTPITAWNRNTAGGAGGGEADEVVRDRAGGVSAASVVRRRGDGGWGRGLAWSGAGTISPVASALLAV